MDASIARAGNRQGVDCRGPPGRLGNRPMQPAFSPPSSIPDRAFPWRRAIAIALTLLIHALLIWMLLHLAPGILKRPPPPRPVTFQMLPERPSEPTRAPALVKQKPADLWGTGTILLVEDEDMVRAIAERALTRQGYTVLTAEHGEAALDILARSDRPDLLISDVMMPVMDGPTMLRRVRKRYPDLPILFMSGYAEETVRKSIDLDHVHFLAKPFSVQQLAEAARMVLNTKAP